jgi:hypothetical protein
VSNLHRAQKASGAWVRGVPFFQTVNALAHLDSPEGDAQLRRAFRRLSKTQKRDGTWGGAQTEWNSFLAVHALRNKGDL